MFISVNPRKCISVKSTIIFYTCFHSTLRLHSIVLFTLVHLILLSSTILYFTLAFNITFYFGAYFTEQYFTCLLHIFFINFYYPHNQQSITLLYACIQ
jgi:hypothetical protein